MSTNCSLLGAVEGQRRDEVEAQNKQVDATEIVDHALHVTGPAELVAKQRCADEPGRQHGRDHRAEDRDPEFGTGAGRRAGQLFDWVEPLVSALVLGFWGVILGTVVGAVMGEAGHWALGGRRDFSSVKGWDAGGFDLVTDADTLTEVSALLSRRQGRTASRSR